MKNTSKIYLVSGVSGVGKTSTLAQLKKILPIQTYDVRDLDERGVPDGGGAAWLASETRYWIDVANENAKHGMSTVICGFAHPERFIEVHTGKDVQAQLILLHASGDTIRDRLIGRYPTPESVKEINRASGTSLDAFVKNNISFAPKLRSIFEQTKAPIVDTDGKTPEEVGIEVARIIRDI